MPAVALTRETAADFTRRIESLRVDSQRKFGKMSVEQMLKHLRNALEVALGEKSLPDESKPIVRDVLFFLIARLITTWPGGRIKAPDYWSPPADYDFERERKELLGTLGRFLDALEQSPTKIGVHPILGPLTMKKWSQLMGVHIHHHMRQFGV